MSEKIAKLLKKSVCALLAAIMLTTSVVPAFAADSIGSDPLIVVSLGDSYSSGEGIEDFYNQNDSNKYSNENWLAHRSEKSWGGLLRIKGSDNVTYTMKDCFVDNHNNPNCKWYFKASSGAVTADFLGCQKKTVREKWYKGTYDKEIPAQLDVFKDIQGSVDYVTFTIGGNDMGFTDILTNCALGVSFLGTASLATHLSVMWDKFASKSRDDIKHAYYNVYHAAGSQATIIVAGYPVLLSTVGTLLPRWGALNISSDDAIQLEHAVKLFNKRLGEIVKECRSETPSMDIHFVDVAGEFDGHSAYSLNGAWINRLMLGPSKEDLDQGAIASAYSLHPNENGAKAYANCVNAKIREIERLKENEKMGTLSGKVCKASDRSTPIGNASIAVYKGNDLVKTVTASASGNYSLSLPEYDSYRIEISAPGYISFSSFAKVIFKTNTYTETFLMVEGTEDMTGTATGTISDALTGKGVEGVGLIIRKGWNNHSYGDPVGSSLTDANGVYSVTLPLGNYTLCTYKEGYIAGMVNIVVQEGTTDSQNGTITPVISGSSYRIVLAWGENPRDLDSHVEGPLSNGNGFHVYYSHKSQYDGDIEVCNLDVDNTTSYGPETITLNPVASGTYYYYIYRFAGSGTVASSGAKIIVYQGENKLAEFNVPTDQGSGDYWNVFAIKDGQLIIQNTITSSKDVSYASPIATLAANFVVEEDMPKKDDVIIENETPDIHLVETETALPDNLVGEQE